MVRLMSLGDRQGVTGKLVFDKSGNIVHHPRMHVIKGGKLEDCDPTPATRRREKENVKGKGVKGSRGPRQSVPFRICPPFDLFFFSFDLFRLPFDLFSFAFYLFP